MNVDVNLGSRSYRIVVAAGALATVGPRLRELSVGGRAALVSDGAVARLYGKTVIGEPRVGRLHGRHDRGPGGRGGQDPGGRRSTAGTSCWRRASTGPRPCSALGGGAVGTWRVSPPRRTCAGSTSCSSRRRCWPRSTPPSAARRRSIIPLAKNLIGAFHQPRLVLVDPAVARRCPSASFARGLPRSSSTGSCWRPTYFARARARRGAAPGPRARRARADHRRLLPPQGLRRRARRAGGRAASRAQLRPHDRPRARGRHGVRALRPTARRSRWASSPRRAWRGGSASPATRRSRDRSACSRRSGSRSGRRRSTSSRCVAAIARDKKAKDGRVPFVLAPEIGAFRLVYDVRPPTSARPSRPLGS